MITATKMDVTEYRRALEMLGLNQSWAGELFGCHNVTGRRWAANGPPAPVGAILRHAVAQCWTADQLRAWLNVEPIPAAGLPIASAPRGPFVNTVEIRNAETFHVLFGKGVRK